jgi:hypothetical protein
MMWINLKDERFWAAAKPKKIVATVDHNREQQQRMAQRKKKTAPVKNVTGAEPKSVVTVKMKIAKTKTKIVMRRMRKMRKARKARGMTLMLSCSHQTVSVNTSFENTRRIWKNKTSRKNGWWIPDTEHCIRSDVLFWEEYGSMSHV